MKFLRRLERATECCLIFSGKLCVALIRCICFFRPAALLRHISSSSSHLITTDWIYLLSLVIDKDDNEDAFILDWEKMTRLLLTQIHSFVWQIRCLSANDESLRCLPSPFSYVFFFEGEKATSIFSFLGGCWKPISSSSLTTMKPPE